MYSVERKGVSPKNIHQAAAWLAMVGGSKQSSWACLPWDRKKNVETRTVTSEGIDFSINLAITRVRLDAVGQRLCQGLPM